MALVVRSAASLKPEIRLAQAISEFEANLNEQHKAAFRNARAVARKTPPTPSDVMRLTAEIDSRVRQEHGPSRCFGPRLTNILQAVQQFAALGDTVVGGSQNIVACGVWSAVRMMLHIAIGYASYLEKLSLLFMTAGRQAPRYQALAIIYPQSKALQSYLSEYFIVIVRICQRIQQYGMKSTFGQLKSSLNDADLKEYQADLDVWGNSIKDEVSLLLNQRLQNESQENERARALLSKWSISSTQRQQALERIERIERIERKVRWLDACSRYDFQTTWKQIRKRGSTSLLPTWPEYQQWKHEVETPSAILLSGKLGSGKSVILANIVDDLHLAGDAIVVYFFCRQDIPESLTSRVILGSLARQYLSHFLETNEVFKEVVPTLDLEEVSALMKPNHDNRPRFLLIDGLDECSTEERRSVLTQISWLQRKSNWRLGFSARLSAQGFIEQQVTLKWHISLPIGNPDIERYIDSELNARLANGQLKVGNPNLVSEIRVALLGGANGMFLWVSLQLEQICSELSDHSIRRVIKSLPRDLSETYARILKISAAGDNSRYHVRLFKFLAAAYVPLTIQQIQEMASVTIGDSVWNYSKFINDIVRVLAFCGSLIIIEEEEQTVTFVHHSARSFCQGVLGGFNRWDNCFSDEEAHREIGETAVTYLSYGIFDDQLSTQVIPKVDAGRVAERIVQHTLRTTKPISHLALSLVKPNPDSNRDIGQFLARARGDQTTRAESNAINHPFLPYAKKFWVLHTKNIQHPVACELWGRLFDGVDVHDLQLPSHAVGPLDNFAIAFKHPLASSFLWAVNHSHVAVFDRLMGLHGSYAFSTNLSWARFRFFHSLLQYLRPHMLSSFADGPRLEPRIIERLLPLAIILRFYRVVEWMLPCVRHTEILRAFEVAVSCGNYESATLISTNQALRHPNKVVLTTELFAIAASSHNPRMVSFLVKMGATRPADSHASALSVALHSDMHQAPLLRIIFILANAGIQPGAFYQQQLSAAIQLLALSPEINTEMASLAITRILKAHPDFPGFHKHTFLQACSIGSFELAYTTWLSFSDCEPRKFGVKLTPGLDVRMASTYPFEGDELPLVLQTVSSGRIRLANWLVKKGAYCIDRRILRRAIMLRNWELADVLLARSDTDLTTDALTFCTNHELLHVCVLEGDLIGIDFLIKMGMRFRNTSTGPMFPHETATQSLLTQDPEYFINIPISDLVRRDAFTRCCTCTRVKILKEEIERIMLPDCPSTWKDQIQRTMEWVLEGKVCSNNHGWLICLFIAPLRKIVRTHFVPVDGDFATGLGHLEKWLKLLRALLESDMVPPNSDEQDDVFAIWEIFGITNEMDTSIMSGTSGFSLFLRPRWQAQMRLWHFINLLVNRTSFMHGTEEHRNKLLRELSFFLCKRSLEGAFPGCPFDPPSVRRDRVQALLCPLTSGSHLPWVLQYLLMRSQNSSIKEFIATSASWKWVIPGVYGPFLARHAFEVMGWTDGEIEVFKEIIEMNTEKPRQTSNRETGASWETIEFLDTIQTKIEKTNAVPTQLKRRNSRRISHGEIEGFRETGEMKIEKPNTLPTQLKRRNARRISRS